MPFNSNRPNDTEGIEMVVFSVLLADDMKVTHYEEIASIKR